MDNFSFKIESIGVDSFSSAMIIAMTKEKKVTGYRLHPEKGLILYSRDSMEKGYVKFLYPMNIHQITEFSYGWIEATPVQYCEPSHDGHNRKGFIIFNEEWAKVDGEYGAFACVNVIWAMYGK